MRLRSGFRRMPYETGNRLALWIEPGIERNLARAAIATAVALLAQMISARVFGAADAYAGGFFFANGTGKRHDVSS